MDYVVNSYRNDLKKGGTKMMILTQVEKYEAVAAPGFWANVADFCHGFIDGLRSA